MRRDFDRRLRKLEAASGCAEVRFRLRSGQLAGIKRRELLTAISEAIDGAVTRRAQVLLNAEACSDGSQLHSLVKALAAGGVPHGSVNDE
jgi:hypothetical protein